MLLEFLKLVCTAILSAALGGIWVSRWKANLDHAEKRIDDLCSEISKVADLASDYWTRPQTDPSIPVLQAKITSGLLRIASIRVTLETFVSGLGDPGLVDLEQRLIREATGGDFAVHNRQISADSAAATQHAGSALMLAVRKSRLAALNRRWLPKV